MPWFNAAAQRLRRRVDNASRSSGTSPASRTGRAAAAADDWSALTTSGGTQSPRPRYAAGRDTGATMSDQPKAPEGARIHAEFRNGSLTAISVLVGFSLSFLARW